MVKFSRQLLNIQMIDIHVVRAFEYGQYVFVHAYQDMKTGLLSIYSG